MRFPDPYADHDDGEPTAPPRDPKDDDTCFVCGYSRAHIVAHNPRHATLRATRAAALLTFGRTLRDADGRASSIALHPIHLCPACVKDAAQIAGLIGATKHHQLAITCATERGCPHGGAVAISPRPLSLGSLTQALQALGWVSGPTGKAFLCPRCVEAL